MSKTMGIGSGSSAAAMYDPTAVASTAGTTSIGGVPSELSLDALMVWLGDQIQKTDSQLREQMASASNDKNTEGAVGKAMAELHDLQLADAGNGKDDLPAKWTDGTYKNEDWYKSLTPEGKKTIDTLASKMGADRPVTAADYAGPGSLSKGYGIEMMAKVRGVTPEQEMIDEGKAYRAADGTAMIRGDHQVDRNAVTDAIKGLENELGSLQSSNETNMIKLQSAVQARSQMIELVSNMTKSFNDTANAVVRNVGS